MKEFLKENFDIIYTVVTSIALIGIVSVMVATGGTADKAMNRIFDSAVEQLESQLESEGE